MYQYFFKKRIFKGGGKNFQAIPFNIVCKLQGMKNIDGNVPKKISIFHRIDIHIV